MIQEIYVAKKSREVLQGVAEVQVILNCGITGDRHFNKSKWPGENITFIEWEAIQNYNSKYGQMIEARDTRRNIVTKGVDLNALVGLEFSIGTAKFRGVELCEPCSVLGSLLENSSISSRKVVRAFTGSGGLRADIIRSGIISVGMPLLSDMK